MIKNKNTLQDAKNLFYLEYNDKELSIGEYQEKAIHSILKHYYEKDKEKMEVRVKPYIADILNEYGIIEIQTRSFNKLRNKLDSFLIDHDVTIVYPALYNKKICYLNSDIDDDSYRLSPRHQDIFYCFKEFYKIKTYLNNPRLHFCIAFLDCVELKEKTNDKRRFHHGKTYDKIPLSIIDEKQIENYKDFLYIFDYLKKGETFTAKSLAKEKKANIKDVRITLTCMSYLGLIEKVDVINRAYVYKIKNLKGDN